MPSPLASIHTSESLKQWLLEAGFGGEVGALVRMTSNSESYPRNLKDLTRQPGRSGYWKIAEHWRDEIGFLVRVIDDPSDSSWVMVNVHRVDQSLSGLREKQGGYEFVLSSDPPVRKGETWRLPRQGIRQALGACINIQGSRAARINLTSYDRFNSSADSRKPYSRKSEDDTSISLSAADLVGEKAHNKLTNRVAAWLDRRGYTVEEERPYDLLVSGGALPAGEVWLVEAKSDATCDGQLRTSIGQLFQYAHEYFKKYGRAPTPVVLLNQSPSEDRLAIFRSSGIRVVWDHETIPCSNWPD